MIGVALIPRSFNPCFTGSTTSTIFPICSLIPYIMFQSLFYWKYHFNIGARSFQSRYISLFQSLFYWKYHFNCPFNHAHPLRKASFNPCFTGSTTSTPFFIILIPSLESFQSLFYWKYHFNIKEKGCKIIKKIGFNPCFTGSTTSTLFIVPCTFIFIRVSILVLLEVPLQHTHPCLYTKRNIVSILVLLEVPLQPMVCLQSKYQNLSFNPCFTGSTTST